MISSDAEAKKSLYAWLGRSLPGNSPGQQILFMLYHEILGLAVYDLPALLPEVWLHWVHKTVRERGPEALLRVASVGARLAAVGRSSSRIIDRNAISYLAGGLLGT